MQGRHQQPNPATAVRRNNPCETLPEPPRVLVKPTGGWFGLAAGRPRPRCRAVEAGGGRGFSIAGIEYQLALGRIAARPGLCRLPQATLGHASARVAKLSGSQSAKVEPPPAASGNPCPARRFWLTRRICGFQPRDIASSTRPNAGGWCHRGWACRCRLVRPTVSKNRCSSPTVPAGHSATQQAERKTSRCAAALRYAADHS